MTDASPLRCPFCGAPETDRLDLEGQRFLVFQCMFTPSVGPSLSDAELASHLLTDYQEPGSAYFRRTCDRLHLHVTRGEAARALGAVDPPP
jgi:hypothetical protein